jgi:diketogulonate reductase-like aldo/keto reductase
MLFLSPLGGLDFDTATSTLEQALQQLGLEYVDMMLVHYPATWKGVGGKEMRQAEWKAMEAFYKAGKARAIGVSHYCDNHIQDILDVATVTPMINQVQYHVGMGAPSTSGLNATDMPVPSTPAQQPSYKGVTYQSFSPLCGPCSPADHFKLINGSMVSKIGAAHGKTGAQVSLKWQVQRGIPVIPKTSTKEYMLQNLDLFDWMLTAEEMSTLDSAASPAVAGDPDGSSGDCKVL